VPQRNIYNWNPNLGGSTEEQYVRNAYDNAGWMAGQLTDTTSSFYQQFRSYMGMLTPTEGTGQALGQEVAAGGNYATGGVVANERAKAFEARRNDFLNKTVAGFAASNIDKATNLLGVQGNLATSAYATKTQKEANENQGSPWQMAAGVLGTVGGIVAAPFTGGASLLAVPAGLSMMKGGGGGGGSPAQPAPYNYSQGNYGYDKYGKY
jgi:hypothetical protein